MLRDATVSAAIRGACVGGRALGGSIFLGCACPDNPERREVLENSYYWRRSPPSIRFLSRTGLGVAPLGSGATPFVSAANSVCPDNLPPTLRRIFVQLKRAEWERVFKRVFRLFHLPRLIRHAYPEFRSYPMQELTNGRNGGRPRTNTK